jgi:bifunctional DNA-binding transcriptional regulator/antitoxin component of YhaV-PrlF toxin-antitoxin module
MHAVCLGTMEHSPPPRAVSVVLNVTEDGRIIIPALALAELGIRTYDRVSATVIDGEVVVDTLDAAIKRAQAGMRRHVPEGVSLVDELIAERRAEAALE